VQAFGLTQKRLFVSAALVLIAFIFVLLIVREFKSSLPVFKPIVLAALALLIALNYLVPDAFIARYNINRYLAGQLKVSRLDINYLSYRLSYDANLVVLERADDLRTAHPELAKPLASFEAALHKTSLREGEEARGHAGFGYLHEVYDFNATADEDNERETAYGYYFPQGGRATSWKAFNWGVWRLARAVER
jgi:hypothetical protein